MKKLHQLNANFLATEAEALVPANHPAPAAPAAPNPA